MRDLQDPLGITGPRQGLSDVLESHRETYIMLLRVNDIEEVTESYRIRVTRAAKARINLARASRGSPCENRDPSKVPVYEGYERVTESY